MDGALGQGSLPSEGVVSAEQVARRGASFDWLTAGAGGLHWVAYDPAAGRSVVWSRDDATSSITASHILGSSVGSGLHSYGGQPYAAGQSTLWMVDPRDGQVRDVAGARVTESPHQYGDLAFAGGHLLGVREDDAGDELVSLDPGGSSPQVLRAVSGFISSPALRDGRLAWAEWDRDVMPWDSCEIWQAGLLPDGALDEPVRVAGGPGESAVQPKWGPDGRLYYMSDRTGWWNLYRWDGVADDAVAPIEAECAVAPWESGYSTYAFLPGARIGMLAQSGPVQRLIVAEPGGEVMRLTSPYTSFKPFLAASGDRLAVIGSSAVSAQQVALIAADDTATVQVVADSTPADETALHVSIPQVTRIRSGEGEITALLYPPSGRPISDRVPLIVAPHAGPTYNSEIRLDWEVQFFTSRGFAVAQVDYRGSTGYGRKFRTALDGRWGTLDVEDCRNTALHFAGAGLADPGALFISGASAGGYTALKAVCEDGPFALAVARSAIVDPERWTRTAPRFQRPHAAILSHSKARVDPAAVRRPVLLIHGTLDDVAPIEDAEDLAAALRARGLLEGMLPLNGAGHSLSAPSAVAAALNAELSAYRAVINARTPPEGTI